MYLPARDLKKYLNQFLLFFRDKPIFIAREITKLHETYLSGTADELIKIISKDDFKGEITLVIDNKSVDSTDSNFDLKNEIKLLLNKMSSKDIAEYLAVKFKMSKKTIYQSIIDLNK